MLIQDNNTKYDKIFRLIFIVMVGIGICLRVYQYLMGRAIWDDEAHLALNIIKYDYYGLSKPLDFIQAAPILFLYSVKTVCLMVGYNEYALRFIPFIASVLTLPLFYYIVLEITKNKIISLTGFLIFSVNITLIYFSSELKQYALDVAMFLLISYLGIRENDFVSKHRRKLLALAGVCAILYSNVGFVALFCVGCYTLMRWYNNKKVDLRDIALFLLWAVVFGANYYLFIHNHPSTLDQRVNYAFAFLPTDISSCEFYSFIVQRYHEIFFPMMLNISQKYGFPYVLFLVLIFGIKYIIDKKNIGLVIFACMPVVLHLIMSALQLYPFWYRLILYLLPGIIIIISCGTYYIAELLATKINRYVGFAFLFLCVAFYTKRSVASFPAAPLNIKKSVAYINKSYNRGVHIYATTPINPYTYYYKMGIAKDSVYKEVQWAPWWPATPNEYDEITHEETNNYLLVYGDNYNTWGYGKIINSLVQNNRIVKTYSEGGYMVSEVLPQNSGEKVMHFDHTNFDSNYVWKADSVLYLMPIWSNSSVITGKIHLTKGKYNVTVCSKGTPALNEYPHNNIYVNNYKVGDYHSTYLFGRYTFSVEIQDDQDAIIKVDMDNDVGTDGGDRNTFIKYIEVHRSK